MKKANRESHVHDVNDYFNMLTKKFNAAIKCNAEALVVDRPFDTHSDPKAEEEDKDAAAAPKTPKLSHHAEAVVKKAKVCIRIAPKKIAKDPKTTKSASAKLCGQKRRRNK